MNLNFIKNNLGKILILLLIIGLNVFFIINLSSQHHSARIITSNFIGYDFVRAITNDKSNLAMLLKPGAEAHNFEPTPTDIINIKNADLFIYVGGESESWIDNLLESNEISGNNTLRLMDLVEIKEELPEGAEASKTTNQQEQSNADSSDEPEYDEHIWTSPVNAVKLINGIKNKLSLIYPKRQDEYTRNATSYITQISAIDQDIRNLVANSPKKELVFGDRFPFRYFVDEYGLNHYASFPGCSEQTEASSQTIAFLINKIKTDGISTVLKIELTSDKLAQTIASETGAKVMILNAAHNISQTDFDSGVTYVDIMKQNIEVLKEALK